MLTKKFLKRVYSKQELSFGDIFKKYGYTLGETSYWLKKYNIKTRYRVHTNRTKKKLAKWSYIIHKGKKLTKKHKENMSISAKKRLKNPINHPMFIDGRSLKRNKCLDCKILLGKHSYYYNHKRCKQCSIVFGQLIGRFRGKNNGMFGIHRYGKKSPTWIDGRSFEQYPIGWTKILKKQIRYRDKYKYQICGCPEIECYRKLDVHHIDYDKYNLNPKNLISLCNSCHMKTNGNRDYWYAYFTYIIGRKK